MPLAHAMWIHGHSLRIEDPSALESVLRHGSAITIIGRANSDAWFHVAVPTPVIVDDRPLDLDKAMLRFRTSGAAITKVHIYDGDERLEPQHDGLELRPTDYGFEAFTVTGNPHPRWGVGISFKGEFDDSRAERRIELSSVGCDFS